MNGIIVTWSKECRGWDEGWCIRDDGSRSAGQDGQCARDILVFDGGLEAGCVIVEGWCEGFGYFFQLFVGPCKGKHDDEMVRVKRGLSGWTLRVELGYSSRLE